ncbi:unnamed protein product [Trifolium pratense]|uniref:Uncharacterized protein n=1 Tax=Trifolium pratense TaxID=57577 RepID=A0ACB0LHE7_TRIPR|nr:unnamed protein product [Trifolium pratense]
MASKDLTHFTEKQSKDVQLEAIGEECKQLILSLPKEYGFGNQYYYFFQGFWVTPSQIQSIICFQNHFEAKDSDVVIASMPKSGITWLKALTFAIINRHHFSSLENHPLLTSNPHELVPFFEFNIYVDTICQFTKVDLLNMIEPRLFGTHIPFPSLAKSIKESNCKIIYICRNPFDTYVSYWSFMNKISLNQSLEDDFERYCKGICHVGPFWDHMLGYLKESIARPNKILFLKYEDLKEDVNFHVKRIAEFLDCPFTREEESNGVIENIINLCSFKTMKELDANKFGSFGWNIEKKYYFRKAEIGDWINYLSPSMVEKLSKIIEEKLSGSGLSFKVCP